jgi:exodeoxyribonuclease III
MRILSWNIQAPGARRLPAVLTALERRDADVLILSETTRTGFGPLQTALTEFGYAHFFGAPPAARARGVVIASRVACEARAPSATGSLHVERWSEVYFPRAQFALAGVYAPDQRRPNEEFWQHILEAAGRRRREPFMLAGDLNSGISALDAEAGSLPGEAGFAAMPWHGMHDLWRHRHRERREYSWYSKRGDRASGFRIDHAFGTASLRRRIRSVTYHHEERLSRASDHSMLEVSIR